MNGRAQQVYTGRAFALVVFLASVSVPAPLCGAGRPDGRARDDVLAPALGDNVEQPIYSKELRAKIKPIHRALLRKMGQEPHLQRYMRAHRTCQLALRIIRSRLGTPRIMQLEIATMFVYEGHIAMEYVGFAKYDHFYGGDPKAARLASEGNVEALAKRCRSWQGRLGVVQRDEVARALTAIPLLDMTSCAPPSRRQHGFWIPIPLERGQHYMQTPVNSDYTAVLAWRHPETGELKMNSFVAKAPHELADVRYEVLLYFFRSCPPFQSFLRAIGSCNVWILPEQGFER